MTVSDRACAVRSREDLEVCPRSPRAHRGPRCALRSAGAISPSPALTPNCPRRGPEECRVQAQQVFFDQDDATASADPRHEPGAELGRWMYMASHRLGAPRSLPDPG